MQTTLWNCDQCDCEVILQRDDPDSPWRIARNAVIDIDSIVRAPSTPCAAHDTIPRSELFDVLLGPPDSVVAEQRIWNALMTADFLLPLGLLDADGAPPDPLPEVVWSGTGKTRQATVSVKGRPITLDEKATIDANLARFNGRITVSTD